MLEEWRYINAYYKVSNTGKVFSVRRNREMKFTTDAYGYSIVGITIKGKQKLCKVHRLVAKAFLPDYSEDLQVNHKNEIKTDNNVTNLEMCTNLYNCNYGSRRTALAKKVYQYTLDGKFVREWESIKEIQRVLGYNNTPIISCCKGFLKDSHTGKIYSVHQAYNYIWRYNKLINNNN